MSLPWRSPCKDYRMLRFAAAGRKMTASDFLGRVVCIRGLCNRLFVLGDFTTGATSEVQVTRPLRCQRRRRLLALLAIQQL